MPDCQINRPLTIAAPLFTATSQPQESGASATVTVTGPTGTVAHVASATLVGAPNLWGTKVPASAHPVAGVYSYQLSAVSDGAGDGTQGGTYSVGQIGPDYQTLWEIFLSVTRALRDGRQGRAATLAVAGSSLNLTDPYYAYGAANNWNGCQVLLPTMAAVLDTNPLRVASFDQANGIFGLKPAPSAAPTAPLRYILGGLRGFSYEQKMDAILRAIRDARPRLECSNEYSLTGQIFNLEYPIPDYWTSITGVYMRSKTSVYQGDWSELAPIYYGVRPDRRLLTLETGLTNIVQIRVDGRFMPPAPQFLSSIVDTPAQFVINRAMEYLCAESPHQDDRQALQYWAAKAEATEPVLAMAPNEVSL